MKAGTLLSDILLDVTVREGSQQYADFRGLSVAEKLHIVQLQKQAGIKHLELTAFAPGEWFNDADELAMGIEPYRDGLNVYGLYFNIRGAERLLQTPHLKRYGIFHTALTESYRQKNYNQQSLTAVYEKLKSFIEWFQRHNFSFDVLLLSTAFGGRQEGVFSSEMAIEFIGRSLEVAAAAGLSPEQVTLADTEGVAGGTEISQLVWGIKQAFPEVRVALHLHPAPSVARESVCAGIEAGADRWEASWQGVGGSPLADGAGGNLDISILVEEFTSRGYESGLDPFGVAELMSYVTEVRGLGIA